MAEYKSALPVRTQADGTDERLHAKLVDYEDPSLGAQIDADKNLHIEVHGNRADDGQDVVLRLSELGASNPDGMYHVDDNSDPASVGLITSERTATPGDTHQIRRLTSVTDSGGTVQSLDVSLHDEDGEAYTQTNPLPVYSVDSATDQIGVLVHQKDTDVATDSTQTHTYTVTAGNVFVLQKVLASASGKIKLEIKIGTISSETTRVVMFNSTANPNLEYEFKAPQELADTEDVVVIVTNLDNQQNDLYSTIEGYEYTP